MKFSPVLTTAPISPQCSWSSQGLLGLGLLLLMGFAWLPNSTVKMLDWYWLAIWQAGFVAIALWLILSLRQYHQPWQLLGYGLDWGVVALGGAVSVAILGAETPRVAGWYGVMVLGYGMMLYALCNWVRVWGWERFWGWLCVVGGITGGVSLGLWLPQADWLELHNGLPLGQYRLLGGYLVLMLPLMIGYAIAQRGWRRTLAIFGSVLLSVDLYTTAARSALVAIAVVATVGYGVSLWSQRQGFSLRRWAIATVTWLGLLLVAGFNPRLLPMVQLTQGQGDLAPPLNFIESLQERFLLWAMSLKILQRYPLTGLGMGNLGRQLDEFRSLQDNIPETSQLMNTLLQVLCELGVVGAIACLLLLFMVMRLWLSVLPYVSTQRQASLLLYGIGGSWLGYAIASFTDYQLEHLSISTTLIFTLVLLLAVAQNVAPDETAPRTRKQRRGIQLVSLFGLMLALSVGLPLTLATYENDAAQLAKQHGHWEDYEQHLQRAHRLAPWRLSDAVDLGMTAWQRRQELLQGELSASDYAQHSKTIAKYFRWAINAAPQDLLLQYNYAAIAYEFQPETVLPHLIKLARTQPNAFPYTHYLLAKTYLRLGSAPPEKIINLLALQVLRDPIFLTLPVWDTDPDLIPLQPAVYTTAIAHLQTLRDDLSPSNPNFEPLTQQIQLLTWWQNLLPERIGDQRLPPLTQAMLLSEVQPESALAIVNQALTTDPDNLPFQILKTWLDNDYSIMIQQTGKPTQILSQPRQDYDTLQGWLKSLEPPVLLDQIPVIGRTERYREPDLAGLSEIIPPNNFRYYPTIKMFNLDRTLAPFAERNQLIEQIQATLF